MSFNSPDSLRVLCVRFQLGTGLPFFISDSEQTLRLATLGTSGDTTFDRALSCEELTHNGFVDGQAANLFVSNNLGFIQELSDGTAAPATKVDIFELSFNDWASSDSPEVSYWFSGIAASIEANPSGYPGVSKLTCTGAKQALERQIGFIASRECANDFGDQKTCLFDLEAAVEPGTLASINGLQVTVTGLSDQPNLYWQSGSMEAEGVRIGIAQWVRGDSFILTQLPPRSWIDQVGSLSVQARPGCDLNQRDCVVFGQQSRFNPLGIAMLAHHPQFERSL